VLCSTTAATVDTVVTPIQTANKECTIEGRALSAEEPKDDGSTRLAKVEPFPDEGALTVALPRHVAEGGAGQLFGERNLVERVDREV